MKENSRAIITSVILSHRHRSRVIKNFHSQDALLNVAELIKLRNNTVDFTMNTTLDKEKYIELLAETVPTVITNNGEYQRIESKVCELKALGEDMTLEQVAVLQLLLSLMQHYENNCLRKISSEDVSAPPHTILKELMLIRGLKQKDMVQFFGGHKSNTSSVLHGRRPISKEQAKALAEYFHVPPALFI